MTLPDRILEDAVDAGAEHEDLATEALEAQLNRLRAHAEASDDDQWEYESHKNLGHVQMGLLNAEIDAIDDEPGGRAYTYEGDHRGVPLGFHVETEDGDGIGTLVHLAPEQAEGLAVDLLARAHAARQADGPVFPDESGGRDV